MGCGDSKEKKKPEDENQDQNNNEANITNEQNNNDVPPSARSVETPAGRAPGHPNDSITSSKMAPGRLSQRGGKAAPLDADGNPIVLPKGDWVRTEGTPYFYSATENLYYHPPSFQFYDPANEMWYDPDRDEWYRDSEDDV